MPGDADDDAAEDVDGENDEAGDRVAADEFRCAVHRAEEGAFLLELAPARLRHLLVNEARRKVGVDRHLLSGYGVESEARPDLGDAGRALGDDQEVDRHQDEEDDDADDEIAAHHQVGEAANDVAGRRRSLFAVRQDEARRRNVEREPQDRRHQEHGREGRELERLLDPQRHHQDEDGKSDRQREAEVDHHRRNGEKEKAKNEDDAGGEGDVLAAAVRRRNRQRGRGRRRAGDRRRRRRRRHSRHDPPSPLAYAAACGSFGRVCREPCARIEARVAVSGMSHLFGRAKPAT